MRCFKIGDLVQYALEDTKAVGCGIVVGCDNLNPLTSDAMMKWRACADGTTIVYYVLFPNVTNFGPYFGSELTLKQGTEDVAR